MKTRVTVGVLLALLAFTGWARGADAPATPTRPNILVAIADDWGREHTGAYGCSWVKTPAFDRVAREGILFNHCYTSNPKCSPCRASLLTGRNSWQLEEACNHFGIFPSKFAVYPDLLENAGYHVGFTGKGWGPGDFKAGGFKRNPAGPAYQEAKAKPPAKAMGNNDYAGNFDLFLAKREKGKPFCFWYGATEPHRAYEEGVGARAGKNAGDVKLPAYYPDSDVIRNDFIDYAVEIEYFDMHLGRILKKLEEIGELDNTLVLVTSDHGAPFPRIKGQIYEDSYRLPLAVRWGKINKPGRVVDDFINVRDFAPTFLEIAGLKPHEQMTGRSFTDILKSEKAGWVDASRNRMIVGKERHDLGRPNDWGYPVRAIRTPEYLYVHNYEPDRWPVCDPETGYRNCDDGPTKTFILNKFDLFYTLNFGKRPAEELYVLADDPRCVKNLADDPKHASTKESLRRELDETLKKEQDPRALGNGQIFDTYKYVGDRKHAYDEWLKHKK